MRSAKIIDAKQPTLPVDLNPAPTSTNSSPDSTIVLFARRLISFLGIGHRNYENPGLKPGSAIGQLYVLAWRLNNRNPQRAREPQRIKILNHFGQFPVGA